MGCTDRNEPDAPALQARRTVLVYQAAQNSLGTQRYNQQDSTEMANGIQYLKSDERLLLFIDDAQLPRLYEMRQGYAAPKLIKRWETDLNSADPATVTEVLRLVKTQFPSDDYGLVLWSHATGWVPSGKSVQNAQRNAAPTQGLTTPSTSALSTLARPSTSPRPLTFGVDVGADGNMSRDLAALGAMPDEIGTAELANAIAASGLRPRYILFDCCQMQGVEAAYDLRNVTDYIAGSPMAIDASGGFYTDLMKTGLFSEDIRELGPSYMAAYEKQFTTPSTSDDFGAVFSIIRTDRLEPLAKVMAEVMPKALPSTIDEAGFWRMDSVQAYAPYTATYFWRPEYYDLGDAMRRHLAPADYARVKAELDQLVIYRGSTDVFWVGPGYYDYFSIDRQNYSGISMFVPQLRYTTNASRSIHGDLNEAYRKTAWSKAINKS